MSVILSRQYVVGSTGELLAVPNDHVASNELGIAMRFDAGKERAELLCPVALTGVSAVLTFGAKKYADHNWAKGMAWGKVIGSMLRHTFKFMGGEDVDSESGLPHVDHIMCNAMFLSNYYRRHKDKDDRFKPTSSTDNK